MNLPFVETAAEIGAGHRVHPLARLRLLLRWTPKIRWSPFTNRDCVCRPDKMAPGRKGKAPQDAQHDEANHSKPDQTGGRKRRTLILSRSRGTHRILASANCGLSFGDYL
jgi:hypothetical protein